MKGVVIVLTLALFTVSAGCSSLSTHARLASAAAISLDTAGEAIDAEKLADLKRIRKEPNDVPQEVREAQLHEQFVPVDSAYRAACFALASWTRVIADAIANGKDRLSITPAVALLKSWAELYERGDADGVSVPKPSSALEEFAKEHAR